MAMFKRTFAQTIPDNLRSPHMKMWGFEAKRARKFTRTSPRTLPWNFITMLSAPLIIFFISLSPKRISTAGAFSRLCCEPQCEVNTSVLQSALPSPSWPQNIARKEPPPSPDDLHLSKTKCEALANFQSTLELAYGVQQNGVYEFRDKP